MYNPEGALYGRVLVELIDDDAAVGLSLQPDVYAHTALAVRLVAQFGYCPR